MEKYKLTQSTIEKLWYYVYLLIDPRNDQVFYVWKWKWSRVYQHVIGAIWNSNQSNKMKKINEIRDSWYSVEHLILRHWLSEKESLEVESSIIDFIWLDNITNIVKWHHSDTRWITTLDKIKIDYEAEKLIAQESIILININSLYSHDMSLDELYQATRKSWVISLSRANEYRIACAVYRWIIREVFEINKWIESVWNIWRNEFIWSIARDTIRDIYLHKSVREYRKQWSQNPIKYLDI